MSSKCFTCGTKTAAVYVPEDFMGITIYNCFACYRALNGLCDDIKEVYKLTQEYSDE